MVLIRRCRCMCVCKRLLLVVVAFYSKLFFFFFQFVLLEFEVFPGADTFRDIILSFSCEARYAFIIWCQVFLLLLVFPFFFVSSVLSLPLCIKVTLRSPQTHYSALGCCLRSSNKCDFVKKRIAESVDLKCEKRVLSNSVEPSVCEVKSKHKAGTRLFIIYGSI